MLGGLHPSLEGRGDVAASSWVGYLKRTNMVSIQREHTEGGGEGQVRAMMRTKRREKACLCRIGITLCLFWNTSYLMSKSGIRHYDGLPKSMLNLENLYMYNGALNLFWQKVSVLVSPNMPASGQAAIISVGLNSTMFLAFLMGLCSSTSYLHQHNLTVFRHLYNGLLWHRVPLWQVCL